MTPTDLLLQTFRTALNAADPGEAVERALTGAHFDGAVRVLAVGKAALPMARAARRALGDRARGIVVALHRGHAPEGFELLLASHPLPDQGSQRAGAAALEMAEGLGPEDTLLVLLSGGSSAMLAAPADPVSLADKQALTRDLLASGAPIAQINTVRRHISRIKGGRLAAAAHPARTVTLAVSDVRANIPHDIGSGISVADPTTLENARAVLASAGIVPRPSIEKALSDSTNESVKSVDPRLARTAFEVVVSSRQMLDAAAAHLEAAGWPVTLLGAEIDGEAEAIAEDHAAAALTQVRAGRRAALLSGGELTMTLGPAPGAGGPNQHYVLALARILDGAPGIHALACDTDGRDGTAVQATDHAGGWIGPDTPKRAQALGLSVADVLARRDSGTALRALDQAVVTGPTGTNVNDFRCILIDPDG